MDFELIDDGLDSIVYRMGDVVSKIYIKNKFWTECFSSKESLETSLAVLRQYHDDTLKASELVKKVWNGSPEYNEIKNKGCDINVVILPQGDILVEDGKIKSYGQKYIPGLNYKNMDEEDWGMLIGLHESVMYIKGRIQVILKESLGRPFDIGLCNMKPVFYDGMKLDLVITDIARSIVACYTEPRV